MKIVEVHINGFGQLHQLRLSLQAPLVVVYGHNEAGKSTLFQFIHTMLFGFSKKNDRQRFQAPVMGGSHGGSLILELGSGQYIKLTRYKEQHQGKAQIIELTRDLASEQEHRYITLSQLVIMGQAQLERTYFHGISSRLFQQLSTISLTELQAASVMSDQELSQYLYHASWESGKYVAELERELQAQQDKLYRPKGHNQEIIQHVKQLDELQQQLKRTEQGLEQFVQVQVELEHTEQSLSNIEQQLVKQQKQIEQLQGAVGQRELWISQQTVEQQLQEQLEISQLPESFSSEVEQITLRSQQLTTELNKVRLESSKIQEEISHIQANETLLSYANEIERIEQLAVAASEQHTQLALRVEEVAKLDDLLQELYEQIPAYWKEDQLNSLHLTQEKLATFHHIVEEQHTLGKHVQQQQNGQHQLMQQARQLEQELSIYKDKLEEQQRIVTEYRQQHRILPTSLEGLQEAVVLLQDAYRQFDFERIQAGPSKEVPVTTGRARSRNKSRPNWSAFMIAATIGLLIGSIALFIIGADAVYMKWLMPVMLVTTLAAGVMAARLSFSRNEQGISGKENRHQYEGLQPIFRALSNLIEWDGALDVSEYYTFREKLQAKLNKLEQYMQGCETIQSELQKKQQQLISIQAEQQASSLQLLELQQDKQQLEERWGQFVAELQLPEESRIDDFEQVLGVYRTFQHHFSSKQSALQLIDQYEQKISYFVEGLSKLAELDWGVDLTQLDSQLQIKAMNRRMKLERENKQQLDALQIRSYAYIDQIKAIELELEDVLIKQKRLLMISHTETPEELQYTAERRKGYNLLCEEARVLLLQRQAGRSEQQLQQIEQLLVEHDEQQLMNLLQKQTQLHEDMLVEQQLLLEKKGSLKQQQDALVHSNQHQQLLVEREQLQAALSESITEYVQIGLERLLINKTKQKYEHERQPEVLLRAAGFMEQITGGQYTHIVSNTIEGTLQLRAADGSLIEGEKLSRGASELLYFCIRLALHDVSTANKNLPLVLDDPCVNFDADRSIKTLRTLAGLSEQRQLIYFTCHKHTAEQLKMSYPETELIMIEKRAFAHLSQI